MDFWGSKVSNHTRTTYVSKSNYFRSDYADDRIESVTKVTDNRDTDKQTDTNVRTWIFIAALHKSPSGAIMTNAKHATLTRFSDILSISPHIRFISVPWVRA